MNQIEIRNWARLAVDIEVAGQTDSIIYERARALARGEPDPLFAASVLMSSDHHHDV